MSKVEKGNMRMNCRVAAVILHEGCILLQGDLEDTPWTLPGGSVELFESTEKAISREMQEVLEVDVRVGRLLWVTEEFFMAGDKPHHQLGFYYLVTPLAAWYFLVSARLCTGQMKVEPMKASTAGSRLMTWKTLISTPRSC